ncbi:MAG TPA: cytochrome-c peroxidase, partial [Chitinophagales bacterium]|nr:cytochrome-c peroxidase [Chitinophagales bacterium]
MAQKPTQLAFWIFSLMMASLVIHSCQKEPIKVVTRQMKEDLGKTLFFDKTLSNPSGQSCASCHSPETGFSDPNHAATSPGVIPGLFGNRNAISIAYSSYTPENLQYDPEDSGYFGGFFMDGRAATLKDQAKQPFLNPIEMANLDVAMVVSKLRNSENYAQFIKVYGNITDDSIAFDDMADALSYFERSAEMNPFTSKFDYYLKGQATFTAQELSGMRLFTDTAKGKCANCHLIDPDPDNGKI